MGRNAAGLDSVLAHPGEGYGRIGEKSEEKSTNLFS